MAKVKLLDPGDSRRKLDRYELIGEIASGGMATVFLGRLAGVGGFQRFVAIKRLHPHLAHEEEFVEMFLDEARLAAGIHHPHVVPILEVGTSDAGYYLVMEYIEGDTLARIMARSATSNTPVPRPILLKILLDSLAGLHAAHELHDANDDPVGLVHRDVSPQNLLVGMDGSSRITDFGVARANSRLTSTAAGTMKGKLAYMAPEQTKGSDLDRRADLFAMGIILWEMLAGRRLFKADSEAATLQRVVNDPIPRVKSVVPDLPDPLDEVCAKSLQRNLALRFQTAAEMADALERAGRDSAQSASETTIASPREVAAYVQKVIGQDISAQRESVRAWLAQSEPSSSMGIPKSAPRDGNTGKFAIGRPSRPSPLGDRPSQPLPLPPPKAPPMRTGAGLPVPIPDAPSSQDDDALTQMRSEPSLSQPSRSLQHASMATSRSSSTAVSLVASSDPISLAEGAPKPRSKKALLALPLLLLLGAGGFFMWSKAGASPTSGSGDARPPATASSTMAAVPAAAAVASAQPTAEPVTADAGAIQLSAIPTSVPHAPWPAGAGRAKPPPTTVEKAPPVPAKPPGDDLSNPYR